VAYIGSEAHYVILDDDFRRHVAARDVDRQVLVRLRELMEPFKDQAVVEMMRMMGKEDLFSKAMIDSSLKNWEQALGQPIPEDARQWLGMLGFKIVIDDQGEVVDIQMPAGGIDEGDGD